jgi:hypothetical protein
MRRCSDWRRSALTSHVCGVERLCIAAVALFYLTAVDIQDIPGVGVHRTDLDPPSSSYRFRYTGLQLLGRTSEGWPYAPTTGAGTTVAALPAD